MAVVTRYYMKMNRGFQSPDPETKPQAADAGSFSATAGLPEAILKAQDSFVATWGQMGATWGISRTMAEVHALLYITGVPLCTDDVMERLAISRGNASMSLRALVDWGLISRTHKRGDRKEYFGAEQDVWALLQAVARERMKREVQPVLQSLYELRDATEAARPGNEALGALPVSSVAGAHNARVDAMIGLIKLIEQMGVRLAAMRPDQLRDVAEAVADQG